jgi:hypothetical protein
MAGQTVPHVHVHVLPRKAGDFEKNDEVSEKSGRAELRGMRRCSTGQLLPPAHDTSVVVGLQIPVPEMTGVSTPTSALRHLKEFMRMSSFLCRQPCSCA